MNVVIRALSTLGISTCLVFATSAHSQGLLNRLKNVAEDVKEETVGQTKKVTENFTPSKDIFSNQFTQDLLSSSILAGLLSGEDSKIYQTALLAVLVSGESQKWSGTDSGASGEITVTKESSNSKNTEVEVVEGRVTQMPPLEYVGENYVARSKINLRGGPGTEYKVVDSLKSGQTAHVLGKVEGKDWFVIDQGGVVTGFASASYMDPAESSGPVEDTRPSATTASLATEATTNCKDIEQSVVLDDGTEKVESFKACQGPNGWEIVS